MDESDWLEVGHDNKNVTTALAPDRRKNNIILPIIMLSKHTSHCHTYRGNEEVLNMAQKLTTF